MKKYVLRNLRSGINNPIRLERKIGIMALLLAIMVLPLSAIAKPSNLLDSNSSVASQKLIKGIVTEENGNTLPGVSIVIKGTSVGTTTDIDGKYQISVPNENSVLVFSFIGMLKQEIPVGTQSAINVTMLTDAKQMNEVVVTALGIKRDKKALGYAVTEIKGSQVAEAKENNLVNALTGKLAGVQVMKPSGGPGSSSRVVIRGVSSLNGNNQPLYVIDGIPLINDVDGNAENRDHGGVDLGDGMSSINSDDIESVNVLKGSSATALYGSRASNGVILITTKQGGKVKGYGISINSSVSFETPLVYPDYQEQYAHGSNGKLPVEEEERKSWHSMWGPKIEGQEFVDFAGNSRTLQVYDNYDKFLRTGVNINNSVSFTGGNEKSSFRFSASDLQSKGILPNTDFKRKNFSIRSSSFLGNSKVFKVDSKITYVKEGADNRPITGASPRNVMSAISNIPNTYNIDWLKNYKDENGLPVGYTATNSNPYWYANEVENSDERNRVFGFVSLDVNFSKALKLKLRGGTDFYSRETNELVPKHTPGQTDGIASESTRFSREDNFDAILTFDKDINENWNIGATAGANKMYRYNEVKSMRADKFEFEELQNVNSGVDKSHNKYFNEKETHSVFGSFRASYKNFAFLEATARNDWSSTLPKENWSYFYPSVNLSLLFNEMFDLPKQFSFLKLRGSWAQVGSDTDPYELSLNYGLDSHLHNGVPSGNILNSNSPLATLKPSTTKSYELGVNAKFYDNRFGFDFAYYNQSSIDQILKLEVSSASSYSSVSINAGEISNKGFEVMMYAVPIKSSSDFEWRIDANYTKNNNEIVSLTDNISIYNIMSGAGTNSTVSVEAEVGKSYGVIYGKSYVRDPKGNILFDQDGLPMVSKEKKELGNVSPDFQLGLKNSFSYKNISLSFLVDTRMGGEFYSTGEAIAYSNGRHKNTLIGREEYLKDDSFIPKGSVNIGTEENPEYELSAKNVNPQDYYGRISQIDEEFILSSDFIKLRELSIKYNLPKKITQKLSLQGASISIIGRNLFYLYRASDNIDPESMSYTSGNGQGLEYSSIPSTRTYGFNINLKF